MKKTPIEDFYFCSTNRSSAHGEKLTEIKTSKQFA